MSKLLDELERALKADPRSRRQIALAARVAESGICRWLSGQCGLSINSAEALAAALGLVITIGPAAGRKTGKSKER
jgi:hypothetical protein